MIAETRYGGGLRDPGKVVTRRATYAYQKPGDAPNPPLETHMTRFAILSALLLLAATPATAATANACNASSGAHRAALLELYTSEGCDSCPPADRWVSALPARGFGADRVVTLAYHVDYWNYLGWTDPFAQARFTERQRFVNNRNRNRTIYTPQLMLDGKDYRAGLSFSDFQQRVTAVNRDKPRADIALTMTAATGAWEASAQIRLHRIEPGASVFLALIENKLANQVSAGENKGKRLEHDFVVRELAGPFPASLASATDAASVKHTFRLAPSWKTRNLSVAAFVQRAATGEILQALALPWCD